MTSFTTKSAFILFLIIGEGVSGQFLRKLDQQCPTAPEHSLNVESSASLILNFNGLDPDTLSDDDYTSLTSAFEEAYASVASDDCFFVTQVNIDTATESDGSTGGTRRLTATRQKSRGLQDEVEFDFSLCFQISYNCYQCNGITLYTNDASRRRLLLDDNEESLPSEAEHRQLNGEELNHGPSRSAFMDKFNELLPKKTSRVKKLEETTELKTVPCPISEDKLLTALNIKVQGDSKYLAGGDSTMKELQVVEKAIKKAYNTVNMANPTTCDEYFRRVTKVRFVESKAQTADGFTMSFNVEYACRGCDKDSSLLDNTSKLITLGGIEAKPVLDRTDIHIDLREQGPVEPDCVCDVSASENRAPTPAELSQALQKFIKVKQNKKQLSFVKTMDAAEEIPFIGTPTPTSQPTVDPVDGDRFRALLEYPYELQSTMFGSPTHDSQKRQSILTIPGLNSEDDEVGTNLTYDVETSSGEIGTVIIDHIISPWYSLKKDYEGEYRTPEINQFIQASNYKALLVKISLQGTAMDGSSNVVAVLIVDNNSSTATTLIPLQEFPVEFVENIFAVTDESCPDTFIGQAFHDSWESCVDHDFVRIKRACLQNIDVNHALAVQRALEETFEQAQTVAYGYATCLYQNDLASSCLQSVHETAIKQRLVSELSFPDSSSSPPCDTLVQTAERCYSCETCSTDFPTIDCCSDSDCSENEICSNHSCFPNADNLLRFTLTWQGDNNYDLHVISPISSTNIYAGRRKENSDDPDAGGQWMARTPNQQGVVVDYHSEHVWFPLSACTTPGTTFNYKVQEVTWGILKDNWTLTVHANNVLVDTKQGRGSSLSNFAYVCPEQ